jgi:antitoxin component of RelBE/YafQ-DinJ toxin-antitoxin module
MGSGGMTATIGGMQNNIRSFRIDDELWLEAVKVAAERGETVSDVIREALTRYVKRSK